MNTKRRALKAAFPYTLPILAGFAFLGLAYGILMHSKGFSFLWPMLMSMTIFAGSMEFVAADLLCSAFHPLYAFFLTLMVNARHLFYGISMLDKFKGTGLKKWYLIFGMCDESFSINQSVEPPEGVDRGWFMFFVTLLNQGYWVLGATLGGLLGNPGHLQYQRHRIRDDGAVYRHPGESMAETREHRAGDNRSGSVGGLSGALRPNRLHSARHGADPGGR